MANLIRRRLAVATALLAAAVGGGAKNARGQCPAMCTGTVLTPAGTCTKRICFVGSNCGNTQLYQDEGWATFNRYTANTGPSPCYDPNVDAGHGVNPCGCSFL
jgi:hypothetical protein